MKVQSPTDASATREFRAPVRLFPVEHLWEAMSAAKFVFEF